MNPEELRRKAEGAADKVGETGDGVVAMLKANWKTVAVIAGVFTVIAIAFNVAG